MPCRNPGPGLVGARGLEEDGGDAALVRGEEQPQALQIVVAEAKRLGAGVLRDAAVHRRGADEPVIVGEEWLLRADRDKLSSGVRARQLEPRRSSRSTRLS